MLQCFVALSAWTTPGSKRRCGAAVPPPRGSRTVAGSTHQSDYDEHQTQDLDLHTPSATQQPIASSTGMQTFPLQVLRLQGQASAVLTARLESVEKYGVAWVPLGTTVPNAIATKPKIR